MRIASRLKDTGAPVLGVEDHHADRRGVDQRFQAVPGPPLLLVPAGVGDGQGPLGGEQSQRLLILLGELLSPTLFREVESSGAFAPVEDGSQQERHPIDPCQGRQEIRQAHGPEVAVQVGYPQGVRDRVQEFQELDSVRHFVEPLRLSCCHA